MRALRQTVEAANGVRVAVPLASLVAPGLGHHGWHVTTISPLAHSFTAECRSAVFYVRLFAVHLVKSE
jgi:hypothetical protein